MFVIWLVVAVLATFVDALLLKFLFWTIENAGYVDHVATFGQCLWVSLALSTAYTISLFVKGILDEF